MLFLLEMFLVSYGLLQLAEKRAMGEALLFVSARAAAMIGKSDSTH